MSSPICAAASLPNSRAVRMVAWSAAACGTALLLFAGGAASAAPDPSCLSGLRRPLCPDLRPRRLKATVIEDGRRLQITGEVANEGTADAAQSTMQVTIGKVALPPEPLPAVTLKDPVSLTLKEAIPADLRGTGQPVTLTVDPANDVPELDESNNEAKTKAFLPALADLVIESAVLHVSNGNAVVVDAVVANKGAEDDAVPTTLTVAANGLSTTATVPALAEGASSPVKATLAVPERARVGPVTVTLTVDQADVLAEADETNNDLTPEPVKIAPDLAIGTVERRRNGETLSLDVSVQNIGNTGAAATQVNASAPGWRSASTPLAALEAGTSRRVKLSLTVPRSAQGNTVDLAVAIVPVPGDSPDNNTTRVRVQIPPPARTPDLSIASVDTARRGRSLRLNVSVENVGGADAAATQVHASAPGWDAAGGRLAPLAAGASAIVPLSLTVPRAAEGQTVELTIAIDQVAGDRPENNTTRRQVRIKPPLTLPDLAVSGLGLRVAEDKLFAQAVVANVGKARAGAIRLELLAPAGWSKRTETLAGLEAGATMPVELVVRVPKEARGDTAAFRLRAAPVPRERVLANNETSAEVTLPLPPHHRSWLVLLAAGGGFLLALSVGLGFTLRGRQLRVRARWQDEADGERPHTCEVPQAHVLRGECKLKPAFRKIEKLELAACGEDDQERRKSLDGAIVDKLNRALWAHRLRRRRRVRALVEPLGERLAAEIEQWLAANERVDVAITAEIKGGKLECEFKRSECVRDADTCRWEEREQWTGEVEHAVEEPVAEVHVPFHPRPERVHQLSADLVALIGRVDVPRRIRAPEAAPLPRD